MTHDPAVPLLEANELALLKLLNEQPAVRENLPLISIQNASTSETNVDGYFSEGHGVSTFAREGGTVYHCYSSYARGTEFLIGYYAIRDRAPKGRDEGDQMMSWLRRHDEYETADARRNSHASVPGELCGPPGGDMIVKQAPPAASAGVSGRAGPPPFSQQIGPATAGSALGQADRTWLYAVLPPGPRPRAPTRPGRTPLPSRAARQELASGQTMDTQGGRRV
jgi:hypothetical protein